MANRKNKLERPYGWPGWRVPCDMLAEELLRRSAELKLEDRHPRESDDSGWRTILCARAALIAETTPEAMHRRLYDIMYGKAMTCGATIADALLLAVGASIDRDTTIPLLPGCKSAAIEMAEVHADIFDPGMTEIEKARLAESLLNFSVGFLYAADVLNDEAEAELEPELELELVAA